MEYLDVSIISTAYHFAIRLLARKVAIKLIDWLIDWLTVIQGPVDYILINIDLVKVAIEINRSIWSKQFLRITPCKIVAVNRDKH